jgi:uncharacterized protein HemY
MSDPQPDDLLPEWRRVLSDISDVRLAETLRTVAANLPRSPRVQVALQEAATRLDRCAARE